MTYYAVASPSFLNTIFKQEASSSVVPGPEIRKEIEVYGPYNHHLDVPLDTSSPDFKTDSRPDSHLEDFMKIMNIANQNKDSSGEIYPGVSSSQMKVKGEFKTDLKPYKNSSKMKDFREILSIGNRIDIRSLKRVGSLVGNLRRLELKIDTPFPGLPEKFRPSVFSRQQQFESAIESVVDTLEKRSLHPKEAIWALAVLQNLQSHLPQGQLKPIRTDVAQGPICCAALGLSLTKDLNLVHASKILWSSDVELELVRVDPEITGIIDNERLTDPSFMTAYDDAVLDWTFEKENQALLLEIRMLVNTCDKGPIGHMFHCFLDPRGAKVQDIEEVANHITKVSAITNYTKEYKLQILNLLYRIAVHIPDGKKYLEGRMEWKGNYKSLFLSWPTSFSIV
ncbi:uncharacterized protein MELLADRAFT_103378 [Melampsora larici-populina 98AG31]|uniref:Uncharacterized protein n=1 Tax=Melampsora larici-populina (strain 98AG31 / pathotype 3-4-7) TaxID=747676 RepID=F4RB98_MELLP|nr:uncharacterized protein MELLADRAFT_103378 [Melampsora larici-populina 98AG31]EGG10045.1 hypothetical protein MELLADRAFT_103378 [Melampsora larici-populina 98AG31]